MEAIKKKINVNKRAYLSFDQQYAILILPAQKMSKIKPFLLILT